MYLNGLWHEKIKTETHTYIKCEKLVINKVKSLLSKRINAARNKYTQLKIQ